MANHEVWAREHEASEEDGLLGEWLVCLGGGETWPGSPWWLVQLEHLRDLVPTGEAVRHRQHPRDTHALVVRELLTGRGEDARKRAMRCWSGEGVVGAAEYVAVYGSFVTDGAARGWARLLVKEVVEGRLVPRESPRGMWRVTAGMLVAAMQSGEATAWEPPRATVD